jgi:hypothetical protein
MAWDCRWLAMAGLTLDILGAWIIVSAVVMTAKRAAHGLSTEGAVHDARREARCAKIGAAILTGGFLLQALGSWPR